MTVEELISTLKSFDPDLDVLCSCEDDKALVEKNGFFLFDILEVSSSDGERFRLKDGRPSLKFEKTKSSTRHVLIEITSDF